jgi:hypothetical protein
MWVPVIPCFLPFKVETPKWIQDVEPPYTSVNVQLALIAVWTLTIPKRVWLSKPHCAGLGPS